VCLWLTASGAALVMTSLVIGKFSSAGWSAYPPYSEAQLSPGVGVDYWIWAILVSGVGSMLSGINFLVTIVKRRAPGMRLMMMPLFTWTALCTSILMVFAFPALTVAAALLGLDRYLGMHFFTIGDGGNVANYFNLFWMWGHPEIYILILPAFGIYSEVVATFSGKRLFGYESLVYATAAITVLSLTVWLHHFFTMGTSQDVNVFFGSAAPLIAVPTAVAIFDWLFTMYRGRVRFSVPMLFTLGFIVTFVIGGMTGVLLALAPELTHNTTFLVAHFHNVLISGALFGYFAGYQYWFPKAFGFRLEEKWGRRAFWAWIVGFYLAFTPLYILGFMGMPQRLGRYYVAGWQPYLIVAEFGAFFILCGITFFAIQLAVSIRDRAKLAVSTGDPWNGRTLEWATASPPAAYNFAVVPTVHSIDAWWAMKEAGRVGHRPARFRDITMPRDSGAGVVLGVMSFVFAFAMVWQIWWLAAVGALGMFAAVLSQSFRNPAEHRIPASEVEVIENRRTIALAPGVPT
jgi:cytochrome o ubiquinol oxidase subunit I